MQLIFTTALKSLASNFFRTVLTVLGIAIGCGTVATILILDFNTSHAEEQLKLYNVTHIQQTSGQPVRIVPYHQLNQSTHVVDSAAEKNLKEDYEIMRSAVRFASLLAFFIGAIIVYYTIGFTIQQRRKELALLHSLGATFQQIALIVLLEALVLGFLGSLTGIAGAFPLFKILKMLNVTTTGRGRLLTTVIPWFELGAILLIGTLTSLLGAVQPIWKLRRISVSRVLQPRFLAEDVERFHPETTNIFSIIVPVLGLSYIMLRPFLKEIVPSIYFYVGEVGFIIAIFLIIVFFIPRVLALLTRIVGQIFVKIFPLEVKLAYSRFSNFAKSISWPVTNVMLVFAFLLALHLVTTSIKNEILDWGEDAAQGLAFINPFDNRPLRFTEDQLEPFKNDYTFVRLKIVSPPPNKIMLIRKPELEKYSERSPHSQELIQKFGDRQIIITQTAALDWGVQAGDSLAIQTQAGTHIFQIAGIADELGFFTDEGTYRQRKSFILMDESNLPVFTAEGQPFYDKMVVWSKKQSLEHHFGYHELIRLHRSLGERIQPGAYHVRAQVREINKDFFIFDVILLFSTMLAALGVANTMFIQLQARNREVALLQVLGMTNWQILKMILVEGIFIGKLGGMFAILIGLPVGWASIEALKALSVFNLQMSVSGFLIGLIFFGAVGVTIFSAIYPALSGFRSRISESIHYE